MFHTKGVESVASITELRSKSVALIEHVRASGTGVLIQRNNEPHAVLLSYDQYLALTGGGGGGASASAPDANGTATKASKTKASTAKRPSRASKKK